MFNMTERIQNDRGSILSAISLALLLTFLVNCAIAQESGEVVRVDTELVAFEVTVTDSGGRPIPNLTAEDFRVFESGTERTIDFFQPIKKETGRPLSIVFALDVSGSMTDAEIARLRSAMQSFIARLADYNSYFAVVSFAMEVKTLQGFTNRRDRLERSFDKLARDQDGLSTHAYDAVDDSIRLITRKSPKTIKGKLPKRAVILISDGFPVGDVVSPDTLIERANAAETSVYSVILPSYSRLQAGKRPVLTPLEASGLIDRTGGKSFYATEDSLESLFQTLAEEITASYAIAFYPGKNENGSSDQAKPRAVSIRSKKGFNVRQNRTEYKPKD